MERGLGALGQGCLWGWGCSGTDRGWGAGGGVWGDGAAEGAGEWGATGEALGGPVGLRVSVRVWRHLRGSGWIWESGWVWRGGASPLRLGLGLGGGLLCGLGCA